MSQELSWPREEGWSHALYFDRWVSHSVGVLCPLGMEIYGSRRWCCCFVITCIISVLGLSGMDITVPWPPFRPWGQWHGNRGAFSEGDPLAGVGRALPYMLSWGQAFWELTLISVPQRRGGQTKGEAEEDR